MKLRNGDRVVLVRSIKNPEFDYDLPEGTQGDVAGVIEIPSQPESNMLIFHPDGDHRMYGIGVSAVKKI